MATYKVSGRLIPIPNQLCIKKGLTAPLVVPWPFTYCVWAEAVTRKRVIARKAAKKVVKKAAAKPKKAAKKR